MSRLPQVDKKPKNNKDNKFRWVDMQWEKFMNRHDEDVKIIDQLREDLITCNKFFQERREQLLELEQENTKLRIALCNLRDEYLDMGGDVNQLELFDKNNPSQLSLDFEIEKTSSGDFEVK
jgi:predicted  nucleic acid-binding Zn-ribbon protein